jgi:hypothetical protein
MKMKFLITFVVFLVLGVTYAFADSPPWTGSGHYTFSDSDPYFGEGMASGNATVDIVGGSFMDLVCIGYSTINVTGNSSFRSITFQEHSTLNMNGGSGNSIGAISYSTLNISGGSFNFLSSSGSPSQPNHSQINLYVLDYSINPNSYYGCDRLTGHWGDETGFDIAVDEIAWPQITFHVIPEPCTLSLLVVGALMLKKQRV